MLLVGHSLDGKTFVFVFITRQEVFMLMVGC